jgi:hypothetical protein
MLPVAVIYGESDARRFNEDHPAARAICVLSPLAAETLRARGIPVFSGDDNYRDCSQARTIAYRERLRRDWHAALSRDGQLDAVVWYVLDLALVTLLHGYDRLRRAIGPSGPWIIHGEHGWVTYARRDDACRAMSQHILQYYWHFIGNNICKPPPFPRLYRLLRNILVKIAGNRRPSWVVSRSDHPLKLERSLMGETRGRQWYFGVAESGWKEYLRLAREFWRAARGARQIQVYAVPLDTKHIESQGRQAIERLPSEEIRVLLRAFSSRIGELCGLAGGARRDFANVLRWLRPDFMLASETADSVSAALFEACGDANVVRRLASHNSFGPVKGRINEFALKQQIGHQYAEGMGEEMLFWNLPSLHAARQVFGKTANHCAMLAALPVAPYEKKNRAGRPFHVLHASNSMRYFSRPAWLYENVNELVAGAAALVRAGLAVENTTYMVRTKMRRFEMNEEILRARFPASDRIEIASRHTRPFAEDLDRADLLVAFRSTTIMQALFARKPVLLWGVTRRYQELPGRMEPPTPGDRGAVYTVAREADLEPMIAAIRDAHMDRPLTDAELAPYVPPAGTMTPEIWARQCSTSHSA